MVEYGANNNKNISSPDERDREKLPQRTNLLILLPFVTFIHPHMLQCNALMLDQMNMQDTCTFVLSSDKSFVFFRHRLALPVFLTYHNMRSDLFAANYQIMIVVAKQIPESETLVASIHSIHSFIHWYACYLPIVCEFV